MSYTATRTSKIVDDNLQAKSNTRSLIVDNRQSTAAQLKLQKKINESQHVLTQTSLQNKILTAPVTQRILPPYTHNKNKSIKDNAPAKASVNQPVIQAVWHYVEETGRERHYSLKDNKNNTFTHTKSGVTYQDTGKKAQNGQPLLTALNSIAPTINGTLPSVSSTTHDPKNVLFRISDGGKIEYLPNTMPNRTNHVGKFLEIDPARFPIFKNGGKRSKSSKIMDPVTLTRYHYDGKTFYNWDKDKLDGKGKTVDSTLHIGQNKSEQDLLAEKLKNGELVDRRRNDRTTENLLPFDVGPYKSNVTMEKESNSNLSRTFPKLSGIKAWTSDSAETNRDHVPSGESLNQRGGSGAYNQGFTIAIPNYLMHQTFSPTFGTDNSKKNGLDDELPDGTTKKRVMFDSEYPATAFFKDSSYILDKTSDKDYSSNHSMLDLSAPDNRARQIGAYRHLYRRNVRINKLKGKKFGINPLDPAMDFSVQHRVHKKKKKKMTTREGAFKYVTVKNKTQGKLIEKMLLKHMLEKKLVKKIN